MKFNKKQFRSCLSNQSIDTYLKICMKPLGNKQSTPYFKWLSQMIAEIEVILKENNQSPDLKLKAAKFLIPLMLTGHIDICQNIQKKIFPLIKAISQFDLKVTTKRKGEDYFKNNPQFIRANQNQRHHLKNLGHQLILFCIQSVFMWSIWLPQDIQNQTKPSVYVKTYKLLKENGLTFPTQKQLVFYSDRNIQKYEKTIEKIQQELNLEQQQQSQIDSSNLVQNLDHVKISMEDQKQSQINHLNGIKHKKSINVSKLVKLQNEILKQKQKGYIEKIEVLQNEILALTKEKNMNQKKNQQKFDESKYKIQIQQLKSKINILEYENYQLRKQIEKLQQNFEDTTKNQSERSPKFNQEETNNVYSSDQTKLKKQILQLKDVIVFEPNIQLSSINQKENFKFQQSQQLYQPFFSNLSLEQQLRFRKALIKEKQIIFKNNFIEIGSIVHLIQKSKIKSQIFITNISNVPLKNVSCQVINKYSMDLKASNKMVNEISPGIQQRFKTEFSIKNEDKLYPTLIQFKYEVNNEIIQKKLILPLAKCKIIKVKSYNDIQFSNIISKVVQVDKRVLSSFDKLKNYFRNIKQEVTDGNKYKYNILFEYLNKQYMLTFHQIGNYIKLELRYNKQTQKSAQVLLDQYQFIFQKQ